MMLSQTGQANAVREFHESTELVRLDWRCFAELFFV